MPSQNSIANHALDLVGETSISDISDTTERATRLRDMWDDTRDAALRARNWRFSIERTSLAADSATPAWGFSYQYQIASNVVRVIQVDQYFPPIDLSDLVGGDSSYYRIEQDKILTNAGAPLKVRWSINTIDVGLWDACFARVMACDLADRLSTRVTGSEDIKARIKAERRDALIEATRANAIEQPPARIGDGSWVGSRLAV